MKITNKRNPFGNFIRLISSLQFWGFIGLLFSKNILVAQHEYPNVKQSQTWADSVLRSLSFEQLIAQKLMVPVWTRDAQINSELHPKN